MSRWMSTISETVAWCLDPAVREQVSLRRAQAKGMKRMKEPLRRALEQADALGIQFYSDRLAQYRDVLQAVAPLAEGQPALPAPAQEDAVKPPARTTQPAPSVPTYVISSATLAQAFAQLTRRLPGTNEEPEWMLAVTGVRQEAQNLRTLEHLIDVRLARQSPSVAAFDIQDFGRVAITLHEHGLALHAIFHSHRFAGPPHPSQVDWRLQDLLDKAGYPAIQAVFSEDGYVRFFARRDFRVCVYGKGVEHVEQDAALYRIVHYGTLPHPRAEAAAERTGNGLRPLPAHPGR